MVKCDVDDQGVATVTLNRPEKHNAFNQHTLAQLRAMLHQLKENPDVRVLVLRAQGAHFSAGADLAWMQTMITASETENIQDAQQLADVLHALDTFPQPTIALVQGNAYGGAIGLICCCDIAIATVSAQCCLSEVKIGLVPATISPYVCRAMGQRHARRYMLTSETITSEQALSLHIFHRVVPDLADLDTALHDTLTHLLNNSPDALRITKSLCHLCNATPLSAALRQKTAHIIAAVRASPQGQDGLNAFLNKRAPPWQHVRPDPPSPTT
ncbi:enoyl-CoA hydratase-related protein, partial [Photobacterium japonica]|uniref:enoyl-CoA hydratase-related protein n=1 Tax=Photobacterium japonica TaxID=2910235 RepID=UPI003D0DBDBE